MGSFESWCQTVGGVLEAAGIGGFLGNRDQLYRQSDAESDEWRDFTGAWWERFGSRPVQTADLYPLLGEEELLPSLFRNVRGDASDRSIRTRLGSAITSRRDRAFGDLFIRELGSNGHRKGKVFALEQAEPQPPGEQGSAEVPHEIDPVSGSDAEPAEPAEPDPDPRAGIDSALRSDTDVPSAGGIPNAVPLVPHGPGSSVSSRHSDAEPHRDGRPEVPREVPQVPRDACLGGCGLLVSPGQKCPTCLQANWGSVVRELGDLAGHPPLTYKAGHSVVPGSAGWNRFIAQASVEQLRLVVEATREYLAATQQPGGAV